MNATYVDLLQIQLHLKRAPKTFCFLYDEIHLSIHCFSNQDPIILPFLPALDSQASQRSSNSNTFCIQNRFHLLERGHLLKRKFQMNSKASWRLRVVFTTRRDFHSFPVRALLSNASAQRDKNNGWPQPHATHCCFFLKFLFSFLCRPPI